MEQAARERESNLRTVTYKLPSGATLCVSLQGAMKLLGRTRASIWTYASQGRLRRFPISPRFTAFPLKDIGTMLGRTERQVYNTAIAHRIPIFAMYPD